MSLPHSGSVPASLYLMNNNNSNQITHDSLGATNNLSDIDLHQQTSQSHPNLVHLAANNTTNNANSTIVHGTNDPGTNASKVSITSINNSNPNDSASTSNPKTLDLEPNPFERSFAQGENNQLSNVHNFTQQQLSNQAQGNNIPMIMMNDVPSLMNQQNAANSNVLDNTTAPATAGTGISNSTNTTGRNSNVSNTSNSKQVPLDALQPNQIKDLHQQNPTFNFSKQRLDNQPMMSPPVLTPGGSRRLPTSSILPPLHGIVSPGGGSVIGTPGIWNTLFAQTPGAQQSQQQQQQGATSNLSAQMLANLSPNTLSLTQQQLQQQQQQQNKTFINIQNQIQQLQQQQQQVQQQAEQQQAQLQAQLQAAVQNSRSQTYSQTSSQVDSAKNTPLSMKTPQLDNNQQPQQPRNISPHPSQPSSQQMMNGNISASQQAQILNFLSNAKKSGLTPNESSMRTGLTPGPNVFNNNSLYSYLTMTPGILTPSLNGLVSNNNSNSNSNSNNSNNSKPPLTTGMTKNFLSALNGMDLTNFAGNDQVAATINQLQSNNVQQPPKQDPQSSHEQPMQYPGGAGDRPLISNTQFSNGVPLHTSQLSDNSSTKNDTTNNTTPINVSSSTNLKAEAIGRKISHEEVDPSIETKRQKKTAPKSKNAYPEDSMTHGLNPGDSSKADNKSANAEGTTTKTSTTKPKRRRQGLSEEEKRQNFLERNRVAASRCRQRKKEMVETMKQELDEYKSENELLKEQVGTLREHALTLRTILFAHRDCDVLTEQVGGLGNLNTVLNTTNYVSQIPDAHKAPESIKVEEVPQLLTGTSTNVQAAVAAAVAHTTNKAIERQHRLSNSN